MIDCDNITDIEFESLLFIQPMARGSGHSRLDLRLMQRFPFRLQFPPDLADAAGRHTEDLGHTVGRFADSEQFGDFASAFPETLHEVDAAGSQFRGADGAVFHKDLLPLELGIIPTAERSNPYSLASLTAD